MNINFDNPLWLLSAVPLLALTIIPFFVYSKPKNKSRRRLVALVARILACVILALSIAGTCVTKTTKKNSVVILADLSDSTKQVRDQMEDQIKACVASADKETYLGLVTFGYDSEYELTLSDKFDFTEFQTSPNGNYTNIYSAVIRAAALLPESTNKRVIIITDGKENIDRVTEAAQVLNSRDIRLDAVILNTESTQKEIQLSNINVPDVIYEGESFNITVTVESNTECEATLRLTQDGVSTTEQQISLSKGTNRFVFKQTATTTGISSYTAEITANGDWIAGNNKIYSFINVLGTPKILVIDGTGSESHELVKLLGDSVICEVYPPESVPNTIADLRKYESIIMMNTAKGDLPADFDSLLDVYVRQLGRGLLTTGGGNSYIMGGWQGSVLETILPVEMTVKDEYNLNDVGMMILIDNSGSMGGGAGSALELAKEGAIKAADIVKDIDKIGVIAFSDNAVWISKMTSGSERAAVKKKIKSISEGNGTMIYSSMSEAYTALINSGCYIKSIILLTDGQPADATDLLRSNLLEKMAEAGIVVTSIAVGSADTLFLGQVSKATGGSVKSVTEVETLPNIIYEEALKAVVGSYLVNETYYPELGDYSPILSEVNGIPQMKGYIMTQPKGLAYTVLKATDDKPLLSTWQYGLGKVVSFMADLNGKWSSDLLASENGQTLIRNIVSYILPGTDTGEGGAAEITRSGDKGIITLTTDNIDTTSKGEATVISPSGKSQTVTLVPDGIGTYTGSFQLEEEGSYVAVVNQKDETGATVLSKEAAMSVKYSDEYDMFAKDNGYVTECCEATGGKGDWTQLSDILKNRISGAGARTDLSTLLLILAIVIIMADIAMRRLNINLVAILKKKLDEARSKKLAAEGAVDTEGSDIVSGLTGDSAGGTAATAGGVGSARGAGLKSSPKAPAKASAATDGKSQPVKPKEKTEEYRPPVKNKAKDKKPEKKKAEAQDAAADISSILKQVDNSRRKKM